MMTNKTTISLLICMTISLFLAAQNIIPLTFTVDVSEQEAPSEGVFVLGNFFNGSPEPLDDNGDGTWSYTASFTIGDTLFYRFAIDQELEVINSTDCLDNNGTNRWLVVPNADTVLVAPVCFNHCITCAEIATDTDDILLAEWQFKLYPNPMEEYTSAYWQNQQNEIRLLQLFSINGQLLHTYSVHDKLQLTIQRGTLEAGLYFLKVQDTLGRIGVQKMVIK